MKQLGILLIIIALIAFVFSGIFSPDKSIFPVVNWVKAIFSDTNEQVSEYEKSFSNSYSIDTENITIEVVSSNVYVFKDDSLSKIEVTYEGNGEFSVGEGSNTLTFEEKFKKWNLGTVRKGELEIRIPSGVDKLEVSTASGNIEIENLEGDTLIIDNVSGSTLLDNLSYKKIDIENISGKIIANNVQFDDANFNNVSGDVNTNVITVWDDFTIETVSGDVELSLVKDISPNITFSSVSGKLSSSISSTEEINCDLEVNTVSGDVKAKTN